MEKGLTGRTAVYVHDGHCWSGTKRSHPITRQQALQALAQGVDPCPHCRPGKELQVLE
ncbi:DUF6233 domain-containing protein [Actinomycetota bacterium Odt1-20B]